MTHGHQGVVVIVWQVVEDHAFHQLNLCEVMAVSQLHDVFFFLAVLFWKGAQMVDSARLVELGVLSFLLW